jgi:hypothetical protein
MGITVLKDAATPQFPEQIKEWLSGEQPAIIQEANNLKETLTWLFDNYPSKKELAPNKDFTPA